MAARKSPIHPLIAAAVDDLLRASLLPNRPLLPDKVRSALRAQSELRTKRLLRLVSLPFTIIALLIGAMAFGNPADSVGILFTFLLSTLLVSYGVLLAIGAFRVSHAEVFALAPALSLSRVQRIYLDAWTLIRTSRIAFDQDGELERSLYRLVDEEARLLNLLHRRNVSGASESNLVIERDSLKARLDATTDPVARESLSHALETCERRLAANRSVLSQTRIDAQLENLSQVAASVRDGLYRLRNEPLESFLVIDLEGIRRTLREIEIHTTALETATAEIRSLSS